jgi:hypothetical protein
LEPLFFLNLDPVDEYTVLGVKRFDGATVISPADLEVTAGDFGIMEVQVHRGVAPGRQHTLFENGETTGLVARDNQEAGDGVAYRPSPPPTG